MTAAGLDDHRSESAHEAADARRASGGRVSLIALLGRVGRSAEAAGLCPAREGWTDFEEERPEVWIKGASPLPFVFWQTGKNFKERREEGKILGLLGDGRRRCACSADESVAIAPTSRDPGSIESTSGFLFSRQNRYSDDRRNDSIYN